MDRDSKHVSATYWVVISIKTRIFRVVNVSFEMVEMPRKGGGVELAS